jgi:integrase
MTAMGRPPLTLGTSGDIRVYPFGDGYQARTKVRDFDGRTRQLARVGKTKGAAKQALQTAIKNRYVGQQGDITPDTRVDVVAELWWQDFTKRNPSPTTQRLYRDRIDNQIIPSLGGLRVRELTVGVCDRHIQTVVEKNGPGLARTLRAVLSGICKHAAKHDALERNPVRDVGKVTQPKAKKNVEALTFEEAVDLRTKYRQDPQAVTRDLPDLLDFMLATGLRLGEACAVEWDDVDLDKGTVNVGDAMVVRERGKGLYIRYESSNKLKHRVLELPDWMVDILRGRSTLAKSDLVFPSPKGQLRDPSNTSADVKNAFVNAGYGWATSHIFRKTVATLMDESGLSARAAADQLGHAKVSMTQNNYYGRRRGSTGAKVVLDKLIIKEE